MPDNNPLFKEIYIDANPDLVFSFLTERDKFPRWMGRTLEMEPRRGGLFRLDPNGKDLIRGEFLEVIRPRRVVFTWGFESGGLDVPPGSTVVEIDLVPQGEGTLLRLTHRALPADGEVRRGHGAGWDHHLSRLRAVAEGRDPGPDSCPQEGPGTLDAPSHPVVPHAQWIASRTAFLVKEKEFTRLRDELSRQRRELPWEHVEKAYAFDGPGGIETLGDLFAGNSQLIVHHFMFGPDWDAGCKSCSFWADCYDGIGIHLKHRDISFVTISRAPLALLEAYKRRMGWSFKWVSSLGNDFNFDFNASFTREEVESGTADWNYLRQDPGSSEVTGASVFSKDADGHIFHTYSCFQRGVDMLNTAYQYMDLAPKGRDESGQTPTMAWLRRHDEYKD